jgi:signal transduction histidine kinase
MRRFWTNGSEDDVRAVTGRCPPATPMILPERSPQECEISTRGFAHDLGNHLQVIRSAIHLIQRNLDLSKLSDAQPFFQGALDSVDRAAALSKRILGYSEAGHAAGEVVYLDAALSRIADPIRWMAGPSIHVELTTEDALPAIFCNTGELENAILNLVANARDAMPHGGRLQVAAYFAGDAYDAAVMLRVTDTGCGMSAEIAKRAFQPLFTTKPAGIGTGLGLARVADFVRLSGGSVQIESMLGQGSSVNLRFPQYRSQT